MRPGRCVLNGANGSEDAMAATDIAVDRVAGSARGSRLGELVRYARQQGALGCGGPDAVAPHGELHTTPFEPSGCDPQRRSHDSTSWSKVSASEISGRQPG